LTPEDKEPKEKTADDETRDRREFLKRIGKSSASVPAAVLLLAAASAKQAQAGGGSGCSCGSGG
jgi:hypothetical protein